VTLTKREEALFRSLLEGFAEGLKPGLDEIRKRLHEVEATELPNLADSFEGGWRADKTYSRGAIVQRQNGTYLCLQETDDRPGSSNNWRLIGKL